MTDKETRLILFESVKSIEDNMGMWIRDVTKGDVNSFNLFVRSAFLWFPMQTLPHLPNKQNGSFFYLFFFVKLRVSLVGRMKRNTDKSIHRICLVALTLQIHVSFVYIKRTCKIRSEHLSLISVTCWYRLIWWLVII